MVQGAVDYGPAIERKCKAKRTRFWLDRRRNARPVPANVFIFNVVSLSCPSARASTFEKRTMIRSSTDLEVRGSHLSSQSLRRLLLWSTRCHVRALFLGDLTLCA